jgi:hypothetical protein
MLDESHRQWLAKKRAAEPQEEQQSDGRRAALLRLAMSAVELHCKGLALGESAPHRGRTLSAFNSSLNRTGND